jgi:hypothetical protein
MCEFVCVSRCVCLCFLMCCGCISVCMLRGSLFTILLLCVCCVILRFLGGCLCVIVCADGFVYRFVCVCVR